MHSAKLTFQGTNYIIESEEIKVVNMEGELERISAFVNQKGGSERRREFDYFQSHNSRGYYRGLSFHTEFFLEGVIINLTGRTFRDKKYFVDPSRRDLRGDLRNRGVCLADLDEYQEYARNREIGLNEQKPIITDPGNLILTLEGATKHIVTERPDFYALTGLPLEWNPRLKLFGRTEFEDEEAKEKLRTVLLFEKNWLDLTRDKAILEFPEETQKYPYIVDEVFGK